MPSDAAPTVSEYMTTDVATAAPDDRVGTVADRVAGSEDHSGFPVVEDGLVVGVVTASDLLAADRDDTVAAAMTEDPLVADPGMAVQDAGRVILRSGIRKLPVVDDDGHLEGIISNADVLRSQIERATPAKVAKLRRTIADIHDVGVTQERREVSLDRLTPTQDTVYADELEGRAYELERGLAEPLVVIDNGGDRPPEEATVDDFAVDAPDPERELYLADGHHRSKAARSLDIEAMEAYVLVLDRPVSLGMADAARDGDLESIDDIEAVDYARHPLQETTTRMQD